jgi:hypothetical protein
MEINLAEEQHASAHWSRRGCGRGLERITVNLTPRSSSALELAVDMTGDTKTDTVNRALQIYAWLEQVIVGGGSVHVRPTQDAELERLRFIG